MEASHVSTSTSAVSPKLARPLRASLVFAAVIGTMAALLAISLAPSLLVHLWVTQARLKVLQRDYEAATPLLERAERWQRRNGTVAFYRARIFRRLNNETQFSRYLEEAQRRGLSDEQAQREWQLWSAQHGQVALVEPYIGKLLAQPAEELPDVCEAFARGFLATLRLADARRMFETWETAWPTDPVLYVLRAQMWKEYERYEEAERDLQYARSLWGDQPEVSVALAEVLIQRDQWSQALPYLESLTNDSRYRSRAIRSLVHCYLMLGDQNQLEHWYARWINDDSPRGDAQRLAALAAWRLGKSQEAQQWLESFLETWPADVPGTEFLIEIQKSQSPNPVPETLRNVVQSGRQLLDQLPGMKQVAFEQPRNDALRLEIGRLLVERQSREEGLRWLEASVLINPHQRSARELLIETYTKLKMLEQAAEHRRLLEAASRGAL